MSPDEYDDIPTLYDAVHCHDEDIVITHEGNPAWRTASLMGPTASWLSDSDMSLTLVLMSTRLLCSTNHHP